MTRLISSLFVITWPLLFTQVIMTFSPSRSSPEVRQGHERSRVVSSSVISWDKRDQRGKVKGEREGGCICKGLRVRERGSSRRRREVGVSGEEGEGKVLCDFLRKSFSFLWEMERRGRNGKSMRPLIVVVSCFSEVTGRYRAMGCQLAYLCG